MHAGVQTVQQKLASLHGWLWRLMHDWRWWQATIVATLMWAFGWTLVYVWASHLGHPWSGRNLISVAMIWPTYRAHRWLWRDRPQYRRTTGIRWSKTWVKLHCLNAGVYWLAINAAGVHYMTAGMAMTIPFAVLAYYMRDEKDFAPESVRKAKVA